MEEARSLSGKYKKSICLEGVNIEISVNNIAKAVSRSDKK